MASHLLYKFLVWKFKEYSLFQVTRTDASCVLDVTCFQHKVLRESHSILSHCTHYIPLFFFTVHLYLSLVGFTYRRATREDKGGGVSSALFRKLIKNALVLRKDALIVVIYALNFSFKTKFLRVSRRKNRKELHSVLRFSHKLRNFFITEVYHFTHHAKEKLQQYTNGESHKQ